MIKYREMNRDIKGLDRNTKHFERGISHERGVLSKKLGDIDTIEGLEDIDDVEDDGFIDIGVSESVSTYRRTDYEDDYTYDSYIGRNTDYIRYNSADNEAADRSYSTTSSQRGADPSVRKADYPGYDKKYPGEKTDYGRPGNEKRFLQSGDTDILRGPVNVGKQVDMFAGLHEKASDRNKKKSNNDIKFENNDKKSGSKLGLNAKGKKRVKKAGNIIKNKTVNTIGKQGKEIEKTSYRDSSKNGDSSFNSRETVSNNPVTAAIQSVGKIVIHIIPWWIILLLMVVFLVTFMDEEDMFYYASDDYRNITSSFPAEVEQWRSVVRERLVYYTEVNKYPGVDLYQFESAMLAFIWQESGGNPDVNDYLGNRTGDLMQSKESGFWQYDIPGDWNSLPNTTKSIDAGIRYYFDNALYWGVPEVTDYKNMQLLAQGYNYGINFLMFCKQTGVTEWSYTLSRAYQLMRSSSGNYGHAPYGEEWLSKYVTSACTGGSWVWPMPAGRDISSGFGARWGSFHRGIDIPCPEGSQVVASNNGTVTYVGWYGTGGNAVLIDCGSGIMNYYYHLSGFLVDTGDVVTAGQPIALSGNTGNSTGPHLHFGVSIDGEYVDPLTYLQQ